MKKNYSFIIISLLISLFIYLFYRTEKTVINEITISIISFENYSGLRKSISRALPLNEHIIYSLPEGLWVFCVALTSKSLFVKIGKHEVSLFFAPLIFTMGLELFQLIHLTKGRFDYWDIGAAILFWIIANYSFKDKHPRQNILDPLNRRSYICLFTYLIVYLAHVW